MLNDVLLDLNKSVYVEVNEIGKSVEKKSISILKLDLGQ